MSAVRKKRYIYLIRMYLVTLVASAFSVKEALSMFSKEEETNLPITNQNIIPPSVSEQELISLVEDNIIQENSPLYSFIQEYFLIKKEIPESHLKKILCTTVKGTSVLIGSLSGIPYFEVGRDAGGENEIMSWTIGITNTIAISGIGSWSYFNLLKGLDSHPPEEKTLIQKRKFSFPAYLAAHTLGIVVAVPTGYMASRYNTYKWLSLISFGTDYTLKTNGFLTLLDYITLPGLKNNKYFLSNNREKKETEASILDKQLLVNHLSKNTIPTLITMSDKERENLIASLYQTNNLTVEDYLSSLLNLSYPSSSLIKTPKTWKKGYPRIAFVSALSTSAFVNIIHNFICSYEAWGMLYDKSAFDLPMAALTVIPIFMLELHATIKTGHALYDTAFYRISKKPQPSLEYLLYPKLMKAVPMLSIALAGVTAYVGRFMVDDILQDVLPQELAIFLTVGGIAGPFLFASYANYSLMKDLLLSYTRNYGEDPKKKLSLLIQDIEKFIQLIELTKPEEFKKFLRNTSIQNILSLLDREEIPDNQDLSSSEPSKKNSRFRFSCEIL